MKDFIGVGFIVVFAIVFGTNAITDQWNMWALLARFGGAN